MRFVRMIALFGLLPLAGGCATLVGGGAHQAVSVESTPAAADFTIHSSSGLQMAEGRTPTTVRLPRKNEYQLRIAIDGYEPQTLALTRGTNGWIWGNLLFGWIVGFAVDFLTGSAYELEPALVQVALHRADGGDHALVRVLDAERRLIREEWLPLVPSRASEH